MKGIDGRDIHYSVDEGVTGRSYAVVAGVEDIVGEELNIHFGGMNSSRNNITDIILAVNQNKNSVFRIRDIGICKAS